MQPKIIVYSKMDESVMHKLQKAYDVVFIEKSDPNFEEQLNDHLADVQGIIGDGLVVDEQLLKHAPQLKVVSNISVGYDNLDVPSMSRYGVMATHTPDVLTETTADLMFGLLLAAARRIGQLDRYVKMGRWRKPIDRDLFGLDVHHKTLGMIGMGRIGQAIAHRGKMGFHMPILYYNRSRKEKAERELGAVYCELDELLRQADFVCLMTPLTKETHHLIGKREFALMKKTAVFINGSRGKTVDEQALVEALQAKQIAGAGLDVYAEEPIPADHPLLKMDHVVTLPHVGSDTYENRLAMEELAAENLVTALRGKRPAHLLNPEVWK